ncbi:MAG: amidohydrolase [Sphingomonadales bacterium 35-56-22]|jgi:imidazolonepropionase-like amidohydrolase|uniref:amidohydrolase n=1 Tax=Sphingorhabdus sp. TaxID=1902408 RepID=UPI000BCD405E|nr:amidohydrolase [Sphingorhabdus sp.]OYY16430.1 MAG: amidohydrolase [Sphingomonadales bacterium 35-56-22]OYY98196.1 MAG: amidohydrolase [Sphingomonadales bacterium 28-56-43]OYZ60668.1 MAG: amidohydrolase [Sphingomonadales bacterium 24-56-14]OZA83784.1 MAG: amidohydrolase [Sphingomonadales bacterium 39-57-19]HQS11836.1 amidohydrolase [Sphingorhabdus sp.]
MAKFNALRSAYLVLPLALMACSNVEGPKTVSAAPVAKPVEKAPVPFPSTYKAYPGVATAIRNVTIYDGEGGKIENGVVFISGGKISSVGGPDTAIPSGTAVVDGAGKFVTPGIIDIHSHLGDYPTPSVEAHSDGNEATSPITPEVWAEHSVWPQDPGFSRALANGGVTALQVLPGSANLMGGRSVVLKNVYARTVQGMKFPGAPYGMKMACGENPKRVYGSKGRMPSTRMGNIAVNRQTWIKAQDYKKKRDSGKEYTRDLGLETLAGVLDGDISIQNHCYRADEMALVLDMAKEFGYKVSTFHHAVESYKIADLLRDNGVCSAVWADWWGFKMEAYDAIPENAAILHNTGACVVIHSDDENQIQRLNQEAAKAQADGRRMGINISDAEVIKWLTYNPAKALGISDKTGSLKPGKMADLVLWNGNPLSVYARPDKVWIDGALMFDASNPKIRPVSDFELGQPGEGDVK